MRLRASFLTALLIASSAGPAEGQDTAASAAAVQPYCRPCQARRWNSIGNEALLRAENVKKARELLRLGRTRGDPELVRLGEARVAATTTQFEEILRTVRALSGEPMKVYQARMLVDAEASYDAALAERTRKTTLFDRLRPAIGDERERILREMEGIIDQEAEQRRELGINATFAAVGGMIAKAETQIRALESQPDGAAANAAAIARLHALTTAFRVATAAKAGDAHKKGKRWEAATDVGELALETVAKDTPSFAGVVAVPKMAAFALDGAAIGLSHQQWHEADGRLERVRSRELDWLTELDTAKANVQNADMARQLAADAIQHERTLEQTLGTISAELRP